MVKACQHPESHYRPIRMISIPALSTYTTLCLYAKECCHNSILVSTTLATVPARVESSAPVRVYRVFVTFAARK